MPKLKNDKHERPEIFCACENNSSDSMGRTSYNYLLRGRELRCGVCHKSVTMKPTKIIIH